VCEGIKIVTDTAFKKTVQKAGREAIRKLNEYSPERRTAENNPQAIYAEFKQAIINEAQNRERTMIRGAKDMQKLQEELKTLRNGPQDKGVIIQAQELTTKITQLEQQHHQVMRTSAQVKNRLEGETMLKYWVRLNKDIKPRDLIYALKKPVQGEARSTPNVESHEKNSQHMAELARMYHDNLQNHGRENRDPEEREQTINGVIEFVETEPSQSEAEAMNSLISEEEVVKALKLSDNDKAAGLDEATYEMWPSIAQDRKSNGAEDAPFDVIQLMTAAFNDIELNGTAYGPNFAEGWMCPIYKNKEKDKMENYHPITILNTNYRLMNKVLAMRLAKSAPTLLHKSQAGFVPGRQISEQTQLLKMILNYAEVTEENGMIIALDQAKPMIELNMTTFG